VSLSFGVLIMIALLLLVADKNKIKWKKLVIILLVCTAVAVAYQGRVCKSALSSKMVTTGYMTLLEYKKNKLDYDNKDILKALSTE